MIEHFNPSKPHKINQSPQWKQADNRGNVYSSETPKKQENAIIVYSKPVKEKIFFSFLGKIIIVLMLSIWKP